MHSFKSRPGFPCLSLLTVFTLTLMFQLSLSQSSLAVQTSGSSTVYIIKFFKATTDEIKSLSDTAGSTVNKKLLTELQFLEKLVRNTSDVLR